MTVVKHWMPNNIKLSNCKYVLHFLINSFQLTRVSVRAFFYECIVNLLIVLFSEYLMFTSHKLCASNVKIMTERRVSATEYIFGLEINFVLLFEMIQ